MNKIFEAYKNSINESKSSDHTNAEKGTDEYRNEISIRDAAEKIFSDKLLTSAINNWWKKTVTDILKKKPKIKITDENKKKFLVDFEKLSKILDDNKTINSKSFKTIMSKWLLIIRNNYMQFKYEKRLQKILEDLYVNPDTDKLEFSYKGSNGLKVTQGKGKGVTFEPYSSKSKDFGGSEVISLFSTSSIKGSKREEIVTPIMKALKGQSTTEVDQAEFKKWLKSAAYVMGRYLRTNVKPDAVLSIQSSSQLNNLFVKELANNLPGVAMIPDSIQKANINKIKISEDANEKQKKDCERILKKAKAEGKIEFKKIHVSLRKFFKGVMELSTVAENITGKNIVILDDLLTTRQSQRSAIEVIKQYNPKKVTGVVLFKV